MTSNCQLSVCSSRRQLARRLLPCCCRWRIVMRASIVGLSFNVSQWVTNWQTSVWYIMLATVFYTSWAYVQLSVFDLTVPTIYIYIYIYIYRRNWSRETARLIPLQLIYSSSYQSQRRNWSWCKCKYVLNAPSAACDLTDKPNLLNNNKFTKLLTRHSANDWLGDWHSIERL